jgi:NAD(P)-dependent dehydrogenase (short-subunit alcohol dehydrogenase family)
VTGATSGIGAAVALAFAGRGARVLAVARDEQRGARGVWLAMTHEIRQMLAQDPAGGAIVNTSSVNGLGAARHGALYSASNAGVIALSKAAAMDYAQAGIRVNSLVPGAFDTPMLNRVFDRTGDHDGARSQYESMIPLRRLGTPEEAAEAVLWLCSDSASYVTGHSMIVDGGLTAPYR